MIWAGRILSGLLVLFFVLDGVMKLFKPAEVVRVSVVELGYPEGTIVGIGVVLLAATALYALPRTSILGAILLTGYLGGAVASRVRTEGGWFNTLFPFVFGCLVWLGLWLRDADLRRAIPVRLPTPETNAR